MSDAGRRRSACPCLQTLLLTANKVIERNCNFLLQCMSPLLAQMGHAVLNQCPLFDPKRSRASYIEIVADGADSPDGNIRGLGNSTYVVARN